MVWFKDTNVDAAEIATTYRTPDQGVSAKSNSNIALNDYRKMTPTRGGSLTTGNGVIVPSGTTINYEDFVDTGGITPATNTYSTGSSKGLQSFSLNGAFDAAGAGIARSDNSQTSQGHFRLGAQTGAADLRGVGGFASPSTFTYTISGMGINAGSLSGTMWFIVNASGYQASAPAESSWSTIRVRTLYPGGSTTSGSFTFYNSTASFNRSDGWTSSVSGTRRIWQASYSQFGGTYSTSAGYVGIYPCTVEFL